MARGRIREGVESSVKAAVADGVLDTERHAAPLAMLRFMADSLDQDADSVRSITPASFLNYCEKLGLTPTSEIKASLPKPKAKLASFTASDKFKRVSSG